MTTPYELFLERALRLEESRFWTWLKTPQGEINLQPFAEGDWLAHPNLNQDELEAFCLNLRLLIQKRDGFSIDQIRGLAQEWPPQYEQQRVGIEQAVEELERRLDGPCFVSLPSREKTSNRDLFDVVFYGGLVHANLDKREEFRALFSADIFSFFAFRAFCGVLFHYRNCVAQVAYHLGQYYLAEKERGFAG